MRKQSLFTALGTMSLCLALTANAASLPAGTYQGQADGFGGPVSVSVEVGEDGSWEVSIDASSETPEVGGAAAEELKEQILSAQGAEIDGVAGATFTTGAVKEALAKALSGEEEEEGGALTDGVYTAARESFQKEHVTVSVTVQDGRIADVVIDEMTDNPSTITDAPASQIPAAIVEQQSYNVDNVTGATFTSSAIKNAVKDCLEQAGGADAFSQAPEKAEKTEGEALTTDILVVGGGAAGMTAAMEAYYGEELGTLSGYSVTLIEKAGFLGGSTSVSGGGFYKYPDETGEYDEEWLETSMASDSAIIERDKQEPFMEELQRSEFKAMKRTNELLDFMGIENALNEDMHVSFFTPPENGEEKKWAGSYYAKRMNSLFAREGVDVRLNTAATDLILEDGKVVGVMAEDREQVYPIYAGKVILACGGFAANPSMILQYAPKHAGNYPYCEGTNTGDGFAMAVKAGAGTVGDSMFVELSADSTIGIRPDYCWSYIFAEEKCLMVDQNGDRFVDESRTGYEKAFLIAQMEEKTAYILADGDNEAPGIGTDSDIEAGYAFKADTLEELSQMIGVPEEKLLAAVEENNRYADGEEEDPFGGSRESKDRMDTAPYAAMVAHPCCITSLVALTVDENCRVLTEDGEVIENLFAAGDLVLGNLLQIYNAGHGVGNAVYSGNIAAAQAKAELS